MKWCHSVYRLVSYPNFRTRDSDHQSGGKLFTAHISSKIWFIVPGTQWSKCKHVMLFMFSNTSAGTVSTIDRAKSVKYIIYQKRQSGSFRLTALRSFKDYNIGLFGSEIQIQIHKTRLKGNRTSSFSFPELIDTDEHGKKEPLVLIRSTCSEHRTLFITTVCDQIWLGYDIEKQICCGIKVLVVEVLVLLN